MFKLLKQLPTLLLDKDKKKYYLIFPLMLLTMALETLGLGLIIPIISVIFDENFLEKYFFFLNSYDKITKLTIILSFVVLFYIFKNIIIVLIQAHINRFAWNLKSYVSNKLLKKYVYQPYNFFLKKNSSEILRNLLHDSDVLASSTIANFTLITEYTVLTGIGILMIFVSPYSTLILLLFMFFFFLFYIFYVKKKVKSWGTQRQEQDLIRLKSFSEIFGSIKELIIYSKREKLTDNFYKSNSLSIDLYRRMAFINIIPRYILEIIAVLVISIIIIFLIISNKTENELIPILGLYVAAIFKVLPSINRIIIAKQSFKFAKVAINKIISELNFLSNNEEKFINYKKNNFLNNINLKNISFKYTKNDNLILDQVDFELQKNKITGIYGKSGSGKSTLIDIILSLLNPTDGEIAIDGKILDAKEKIFNLFSYVPQKTYILDNTIYENIILGEEDKSININQILKDCLLNEYVENLPDKLNTKAGEKGIRVSGGQIQRIALARALYSNKDILILDEATSAIDIATEKKILENLKKYNKTIIMVTHRPANLDICDVVYEISNKKEIKK